jgi:hypothetical protein
MDTNPTIEPAAYYPFAVRHGATHAMIADMRDADHQTYLGRHYDAQAARLTTEDGAGYTVIDTHESALYDTILFALRSDDGQPRP